MFGITESWLGSQNADQSIAIMNYSVIRRDPVCPGQTGIAVYIHESINSFTRRRRDLESEQVESVWLQVKASKSAPLMVGFIYRHKSSSFAWYDDFITMIDKVKEISSNILLLGDFNIDMFKSHPSWECTTNMVGLKQLVTEPTRVTETSATLLDHIYTTDKSRIAGVTVPKVGISDHFATCCNWVLKTDKVFRKQKHTTIRYRSLKNFDKDEFLFDLSQISFDNVYNYSNPDDAMSEWYRLFLSILDKHAPYREKRVKSAQLPLWLNKDIMNAMKIRDQLKRDKKISDYRKQRNHVRYLVKEAQRQHFNRLMNDKKDITSVWRAINEFTKSRQQPQCTNITPDEFNLHFHSIAKKLLDNTHQTAPDLSQKLADFCRTKTSEHISFNVPLLSVFEVGKTISSLKNKRTSGHDGISSTVLKLALPYIVESLTYIYNLCIQQSTFPDSLKKAKIIPIPKTKDLQDPNHFRPISILSTISKPIERHIHRHLQHFVEKHSLLYPLQSGFRPRHSCPTALIHMVDRWLGAMNDAKMTGTVFFRSVKGV